MKLERKLIKLTASRNFELKTKEAERNLTVFFYKKIFDGCHESRVEPNWAKTSQNGTRSKAKMIQGGPSRAKPSQEDTS
jgi:hypothetical protein